MQPFVVDLYHGDAVRDFGLVKAAGIVGVIHKASQGIRVNDPTYAARRFAAKAAGLLWGAYHFNTGDDVVSQVDHFLQAAKPDGETLMALDFEDNSASEMSVDDCADFLDILGNRIKQRPVLYGGNRIREQLPKASAATRAFVASHPLWLCEYGALAKLPPGWSSYFLWQFTGDGVGPQPHSVQGISTAGIDLSTYGGNAEQLAEEWAA
jgi:GH25 family lysozyme M1 (1,4-beta-N-acetylmuramidase)